MAWTPPRTWSTGEFWTAALVNEQLRDNMLALTPIVGELRFFVRQPTAVETVIGLNYLECNGAAVSRSNYSALYTLLAGMKAQRGTGTTTLAAALDAVATSLTIASYPNAALGTPGWPGDQATNNPNWYHRTYGLEVPFSIQIDSEIMLVTSVGASPFTTLQVSRAREGTTAASHNQNATVSLALDMPFGSGDGATTFHLPDLHGRMPFSAARAGGHTDVLTIGRNDRAALAARRARHRHETMTSAATQTGNQVGLASGTLGTTQMEWEDHGGISQYNNFGTYVGPLDQPGFYHNFSGTTTPVDSPGYVVMGVWGIRFLGL